MIIKRLWIGVMLVGMLACKTTLPMAEQSQRTVLLPEGPAWAALWQQQSAEYKALCFQAYQLAALRLDQHLQQQRKKPLAIVTDIDETVLDNSPYTVHEALKGQEYTEKTWLEWTSKAIADTVPGALSFLKYAAFRGVAIYYVTNRLEKERGATLENLRRWQFPDADDAHLLLKTTTSEKEARRQQVLATHDVVLFIGDNLSDFAAIFDKKPYQERAQITKAAAADFGNRFIVLPNPMYGDWEGALYNFQYNLSVPQKDSILRSRLKNY
jgi:5'-nucleotidase (lipoprotein e(P4) family)